MNLPDLEDDERTALLGLITTLVGLHHGQSPAEMEEFRAIAQEMGRHAFDVAFHQARLHLPDADSAVAYAAEHVNRPDARDLLLTVLTDLAQADGISDAEHALITRIRAAWGP